MAGFQLNSLYLPGDQGNRLAETLSLQPPTATKSRAFYGYLPTLANLPKEARNCVTSWRWFCRESAERHKPVRRGGRFYRLFSVGQSRESHFANTRWCRDHRSILMCIEVLTLVGRS